MERIDVIHKEDRSSLSVFHMNKTAWQHYWWSRRWVTIRCLIFLHIGLSSLQDCGDYISAAHTQLSIQYFIILPHVENVFRLLIFCKNSHKFLNMLITEAEFWILFPIFCLIFLQCIHLYLKILYDTYKRILWLRI